MDAEFDTVAEWTAEVARDLGPQFHEPAGCRGSGSPAALDWLIDRLQLEPGSLLLDCGAGVGGPAAYAARSSGVRPVLTEPEGGACRAAASLFGLPVVQAATDLPFGDDTFDAGWSLGVLCTVAEPDQGRFLREAQRVLRPGARLGLLVFVRRRETLTEQPEGNTFPDLDRLTELITRAGLTVDAARDDDLGPPPTDWQDRTEAVEQELARRHGGDPAWQTASDQAAVMGRLLSRGEIAGRLVVATA